MPSGKGFATLLIELGHSSLANDVARTPVGIGTRILLCVSFRICGNAEQRALVCVWQIGKVKRLDAVPKAPDGSRGVGECRVLLFKVAERRHKKTETMSFDLRCDGEEQNDKIRKQRLKMCGRLCADPCVLKQTLEEVHQLRRGLDGCEGAIRTMMYYNEAPFRVAFLISSFLGRSCESAYFAPSMSAIHCCAFSANALMEWDRPLVTSPMA